MYILSIALTKTGLMKSLRIFYIQVNVCNLSDKIRAFVFGRAIFKSIVANFLDLRIGQVSKLVTQQFICVISELKTIE